MASKNLIIIYARIGSSRLPGKAVLSLGEFKVIELVINRVKKFNHTVDADILLATTCNKEDDVLEEIAFKNDIKVFRGNENNVVQRTVDILNLYKYHNFCRINGDCPLVDGNLIGLGYKYVIDGYDFVSNIIERSFPYGIAVEWLNTEMYLNYASFVQEEEKEHVTKHIYRLKNNIKYFNILNNIDQSNTALTIDTKKDLIMFQKLLKEYPRHQQLVISYKKILNNLKN